MKSLFSICVLFLCLITTGCSSDMNESVDERQYDITDNQPVLEFETIELDELNNESNSMNSGSDIKYEGYTYTFYEVESCNYTEGHWLRGIYDEEPYVYDASYHGLFIGQVVTMFGDDCVTGDNEALISVVVAAEDNNKNIIYLEVYYGPSGPAIGGNDGENYEKAALELERIIRGIEPIDYECVSVYGDYEVTIRMGTRNGKGFYETDMDW